MYVYEDGASCQVSLKGNLISLVALYNTERPTIGVGSLYNDS